MGSDHGWLGSRNMRYTDRTWNRLERHGYSFTAGHGNPFPLLELYRKEDGESIGICSAAG
jgi:hypothetical protein